MANQDKIETIDKLISGLQNDLRDAKAAANSIPFIEEQLATAKILRAQLTGTKPISLASAAPATPTNGNGTRARLIRAKNVGDLAFIFLRDNCPGATALELHAKMKESGAAVGASEYCYTILRRLEEHGFVRYEVDERGTKHFFAIERDDLPRRKIHAKIANQVTQ